MLVRRGGYHGKQFIQTNMRRALYEICVACVTVSKFLVSFGVHLGGKTAAAPQSRHNVGAEGRRRGDLEG